MGSRISWECGLEGVTFHYVLNRTGEASEHDVLLPAC